MLRCTTLRDSHKQFSQRFLWDLCYNMYMTERFKYEFEVNPPITSEDFNKKLTETLRLLDEEYGENVDKPNKDGLPRAEV